MLMWLSSRDIKMGYNRQNYHSIGLLERREAGIIFGRGKEIVLFSEKPEFAYEVPFILSIFTRTLLIFIKSLYYLNKNS